MGEIAKRYAAALHSTASHSTMQRDAVQIEAQLAELMALFTGSQPLRTALCSPCVTTAEKHAVLDALVGDKDAHLISFLKLLCDNGRIGALPEIAREYHALTLAEENAALAVLWYAVPPTEQAKDRLVEMLKMKYKKRRIELQLREDPALVGGFVLEIFGKRVDSSIHGMLSGLQSRLSLK